MRFTLDPTSPSGVTVVRQDSKPVRTPGYVVNKVTGLITAGTNITLSGNGTDTSPYKINSTGGGGGTGTGTVDSVVAGTGITVDATDPSNPIVASSITQYTDALASAAAPVQSVAGRTGTVTLAKADVGLGNVDNTSDATKNAATVTLTNKTISGSSNTLSSIPESAVTNLTTDLAGKQATLTLTTTGTSGAASLTGATLNIPNYASGGGTTLPTDAAGWLHDNGTGTLAWTTPAKSDVGLGNVDNTSDATKNAAVATLTNKDLTSGTNTFPTFNQSTTGSAAKWTTPRNLAGNAVDGSAAVAFANKFIVQGTTDTGLSAAQFLGALTTGILKVTTTTGVLSTAVAADFPTLNQNTTGTAANVTGTIVVGNGGTGATTLTGIVKGNGTSAMTAATAGTDYSVPTGTETLTNKTLTSPVINTGTVGADPSVALGIASKQYIDNKINTTATANKILPLDASTTYPQTVIQAACLGYQETSTTNQTSITTQVDLTGASVTVTVPTLPTGRKVRITGFCQMFSSVTNDVGALTIMEGVTTLRTERTSLNSATSVGAHVTYIFSPTAASHTYKLQIGRVTGTGTLLAENSVTPGNIMVEIV